MSSSCHDTSPLPTRRSLHAAAQSPGARIPPAAGAVAPPARRLRREQPAPTPVASRRSVARGVPARARRLSWRRLPHALLVACLAGAAATYSAAGDDVVASAGEVPHYERAATVVDPSPEQAPVTSELVVGPRLAVGADGLRRVDPDAASRSGAREPLPGCDGVPPETLQPNGQLEERFLCTLWDGQTQLRADAAVALVLLNEQYRAATGADLCLTSGYRTFEQQEGLRRQKPGLAAPAGTSEHGNGLAVDLCGGVEAAGPGYDWLRANGPAAGFDNPDWARQGGSGPYEPWHWEYVDGQW